MKIEKKNKSLDEFLNDLDLANLDKDMLFSDLEDDEPEKVPIVSDVQVIDNENYLGEEQKI